MIDRLMKKMSLLSDSLLLRTSFSDILYYSSFHWYKMISSNFYEQVNSWQL